MSAAAAFDSFSCYIDLLNYQKNEITDSVCNLLNVKTNLLEEGMLLCTYGLPASNSEFKLFLRQFYKQPVHLKNFTLDVGSTQTTVKCRIAYDTCAIISNPLFCFSNRTFKNVGLLRKQLQNLSFTYKISKSHLYFQVMQCDVETDIHFYYNATLDTFASPPTGMTYTQFLFRNKHRILHHNNHPANSSASVSPAPGSQFQAGVQQPTSGQQVQQLDQAAAQHTAAPGPSQTIPPPPSIAPAASTAAAVNVAADEYETPRASLRFGPQSTTIGRSLFPQLDDPEDSRPPLTATATRLESLKIAMLSSRAQNNQRIIRDLAQVVNLKVDTDQISDLFTSQPTWNVKKVGMLTLALFGIITVTDKRSEVSAEKPDGATENQVDDFQENDYEPGKEPEKEKQ